MHSPDLQRLLDLHEIANLQGRYLYHLQAHDYPGILGLFAQGDPRVSVEVAESGVYEGLTKIRALFMDLFKPLFTLPGSLPLHMLTTPVIELEPDGRHARGMWQTLGCNTLPGEHGMAAVWQVGKYDNRFIKEEGQWRFLRFRWLCHLRTPYEQGWVRQPMYSVPSITLSALPAALQPTRPGERHEVYSPQAVMDFGPLPPPPR